MSYSNPSAEYRRAWRQRHRDRFNPRASNAKYRCSDCRVEVCKGAARCRVCCLRHCKARRAKA